MPVKKSTTLVEKRTNHSDDDLMDFASLVSAMPTNESVKTKKKVVKEDAKAKDALDAPMDDTDITDGDADRGISEDAAGEGDAKDGYGYDDGADHDLGDQGDMDGVSDLDFVLPDEYDYDTDSLKGEGPLDESDDEDEDDKKELDEDAEKADDADEDDNKFDFSKFKKEAEETDDEDKEDLKEDDESDKDEDDKKVDESEEDDKDEDKLDESEDDEEENDDLDEAFMGEAEAKRISEALGIDASKLSEVQVLLSVAVNERVKARVEAVATKLKTRYQAKFESTLAKTEKAMVEKVDLYATHVVENWAKKNTVALQERVTTNLMESLAKDIFGVFAKHNVEVPKAKTNAYAKLVKEHRELAAKFNEVLGTAKTLQESVRKNAREEVLNEATKGLSEVGAAKLRKLAGNLKFEDAKSFADQTKLIRESFVTKKTNTARPLTEGNSEAAPHLGVSQSRDRNDAMKNFTDYLDTTVE